MNPSLFRIRPRRPDQKGMILVAVTLAVVTLMTIAVVVSDGALGSARVMRHAYQHERVFYAAEGGADYAQEWLSDLLDVYPHATQTQIDAMPQPTLPGFHFEDLHVTKLPIRHNVPITDGPNRGLTAEIQPFEIIAHAENGTSSADETVHLTVQQEMISLYQYGIYYQEDLELFPSFPLDYMGRVHCNGDVYVGSHNTLDLDAVITAAGHIYNTPKDPSVLMNGKVRFKDTQGIWHDFDYDWRDPDWVQKSLGDWDGNVEDSSHGVIPLPAPLAVTRDPHDIIELPVVGEPLDVRVRKYYYKAGLRIVDGVASDSLGNPVVLPAGVIDSSSVYDYREQRTMQMRNLNVAALIAANLVPANRCIYITYTHAAAAVRLRNGASLPQDGLVIATANPLYVQGDYNTINKQPSSLFCDAFNVYSNLWADVNATRLLNQRIASATAMNTCVVTGNETTVSGAYGGGAENLIRLHEKWIGHELTFRGSLVCLWTSEQATGLFINASYVEAQRDWAFDPDLLDPRFWPKQDLAATHLVRARWWLD